MAKPKKPLLSFGAKGTIADALTFQKRGQATIARKKPIPKDPESPGQLTQRQVYLEAIDAWHALTTQEKEAWRGVYPGLTAYQCFMRYKIRELLKPPAPEEYTEEQTQHNVQTALSSFYQKYLGQRLTISNRKVTKLGFWLYKVASPTGDVIFQIRRITPDQAIVSKVWGDASALQFYSTYEELTLDAPILINEEVRICVHYTGGDWINCINFRWQDTDVKADEYLTYVSTTTWIDITDSDAAYRYKYYLP